MSSSFNTSLTSQRKADLEELRVLAAEVIGFVDDEEKMEVREQMENLQTLSEGIMDTVARMVKVNSFSQKQVNISNPHSIDFCTCDSSLFSPPPSGPLASHTTSQSFSSSKVFRAYLAEKTLTLTSSHFLMLLA
jgi:hypothetical protein